VAGMTVRIGAAMALILVSGCSSIAGPEASAAAARFVQAQPAQACELLAPDTAKAMAERAGTDCQQALAAAHLPADSPLRTAEVAGQSAQVQFDDEVVFLARFPDGWRVTAAGCVRDDPDPAVPYDCEVEP